jgi:hypothetical protein
VHPQTIVAAVTALLLLATGNGCGGGGGGGVGGGESTESPPDSAVASTVALRWLPVANVAGYVVHWGTASLDYTSAVNVGRITPGTDGSVEVAVEAGAPATYYFAVTCYDGAGNESAYSNEIALDLGAA